MNPKLRALICKTQLKNMKAAGFKLLDVVDTGEFTICTTETLKLAKWRFEHMIGTDYEFYVEIDIPTNYLMSKGQIYERIYNAGMYDSENGGRR
jgi:hypothetical protein